MPQSLRRWGPPVAVLLFVLLLAGGLIFARRRADSDPPVAATGTARPPAASVVASVSGRLLVSEYRVTETALLSVAAADLNDRRRLLRVEHARNWAPRFAAAPVGGLIAYTMLPPEAVSPDTEGVLWLVSPREKDAKRLAAAVDVRSAPRWSPDGAYLAYGRTLVGGPNGVDLLIEEVDTRNGKAVALARASGEERLTAVGYRDPERFLYVRFERGGAFLQEVSGRGRTVRTVARLASGAARDFTIAPDGRSLAYLALEGTPPLYAARVVDMSSGDIRPLLEGTKRTEDVGVAWRPGQPATVSVGMITPGAEQTGLVADSGGIVAASATGFDVPVAWSADGRYLVTRAFSGKSSDDPGRERLTVLDREGVRRPLTGEAPLAVVGWSSDAP